MKIMSLKNNDGQWSWTEKTEDWGDMTQTAYRTNQAGDGLWQWIPTSTQVVSTKESVYEWKQICGTSQFSLNNKTKSAAYSYIRRHRSPEANEC